jgi:peroxiredoxin
MALTPSTMLALGTPAPDFRLPDTAGKMVALGDFKSAPALAVFFICNHCPYVKHIQAGLAQFARDYQARGAAIVAISSNDVQTHPEDSPARMAREAKSAGYIFPYLYDESQAVAKAYQAACTPDIFLFDARSEAGLSRPIRRKPAGQRRAGDGPGFARRDGRGPGWQAGFRAASAERGLQHQMEIRPRPGLLLTDYSAALVFSKSGVPGLTSSPAGCTSRPKCGISGQYQATAATTKIVAIPPETTEKTGPK